jgi:hypothetical protein
VFTARYALSPYIKQIIFVFKGLIATVAGDDTRYRFCTTNPVTTISEYLVWSVSAAAVADYVTQSLKALNILLLITAKIEIEDLHCGLIGYDTMYSHCMAHCRNRFVRSGAA